MKKASKGHGLKKPSVWNVEPVKPIKLDYESISMKYIEMTENNHRLQMLVSKFTRDPDRKLKSVYESVQFQSNMLRNAKKTSENSVAMKSKYNHGFREIQEDDESYNNLINRQRQKVMLEKNLGEENESKYPFHANHIETEDPKSFPLSNSVNHNIYSYTFGKKNK